jgi:hypothetical protein
MAPLIEQLSNGHFGLGIANLGVARSVAAPTHAESACGCGCGQPTAAGRKFVSQEHYDRSKGLATDAATEALARLKAGESAKGLAQEYGVAHTTIYRLLTNSDNGCKKHRSSSDGRQDRDL